VNAEAGATPRDPAPLSAYYYLDNFQRLCDTVEDQYGDLLSPAERAFLDGFAAAPRDVRGLYVRLVSRRGPLFRREQLNYGEIADLPAALEQGQELGLLVREETPPIDVLQALLRKPELLAIYGDLLPSASVRKPELVAAINAQLNEVEWLARWRAWREPDHWLVGPAFAEQVALLRLLFFGNTWQELTEFVITDLGLTRYHPYPLSRRDRLFDTREEIDEVLALDAVKASYKRAVSEHDLGTVLAVARHLRTDSTGPVAAGLRDRLRNRVARQLERMDAIADAEALYRDSQQTPARERRVRLLSARGDYRQALALCEAIQSAPWSEDEVDFAARQVPALKRKLGDKVPARPRDAFTNDHLVLPYELPVELAAARHYSQHWEAVHYVENLVINASFGLAFWDQMFTPVPGAFVHPFQSAPLDMFSRGFHAARRESVDQRLAELEGGDIKALLLANYNRHEGVSNTWVGWRGLNRDLLAAALAIIPREHWLAIWRRLLFDPEANRNGCPDLLALDEERGYCLIEVKGPGDALQLHQRRWLRFFQARGIPARVAWVSWQEPLG